MPAPAVRVMADLIEKVYELYPEARDFDPCPCGLTLAIIPEECIKPWHFPVRDDHLRALVRNRIIEQKLGFTNKTGGVLVLCEIA